MREPEQERPFGRTLFLLVFHGNAVRNAYELRLFSHEFGLSLICWAISSVCILLRFTMVIALPSWLTISLAVFSVFSGCCWVALPLLVYLARKTEQFLAYEITPGKLIKTLTGAALWHQAAQGRLTLQFFGALLVESGFIWVLFPWRLSAAWQVFFHGAFFLNTIFYLIFPLLLFLGAWIQRGVHTTLFHQHSVF